MRFIALAFAILAIIPQALRGMAIGVAKIYHCTLPARDCEISDNDQSHIINLMYNPSFYNTKGLWIGLAGLVVSLIIMKIITTVQNRRFNTTYDRADRERETGRDRGETRMSERGTRSRPRPSGFTSDGRPRD